LKVRYFDLQDFYSLFRWMWRNPTKEFEEGFAQYIGGKYAIATSYGRTALYLALRAIEAKGYEVILPSFICTVVRQAVVQAGAKPRFVDVNYSDLSINLEDLKSKINSQTRAILLIHYFGNVAPNFSDILQIVKESQVVLIEDCAHSLGAVFQEKKVGTFGDLSIFSLTKNSINFGGGVLVTNNKKFYLNAKRILEAERISLKKRIVDFPILLSYGAEQFVQRLLLDRIKISQWKWKIIRLPIWIIKIRSLFFYLIFHIKSKKKTTEADSFKDTLHLENNYYPVQPLKIEPLISSLALSQLKKLDLLNKKRQLICAYLDKCKFSHISNKKINHTAISVGTNKIFSFNHQNIFILMRKYQKRGISLKPTWPTHQSIWDEQNTDNLRRIAHQILTMNIHPDLTKGEIEKILKIFKNDFF